MVEAVTAAEITSQKHLADYHEYRYSDSVVITFEGFTRSGSSLTTYAQYMLMQENGGIEIIDHGNLNLNSSGTRKSQAKTLADLYDGIAFVDWADRLNTISRESKKAYAEGPPVIDLSTVIVDPDKEDNILAPYICNDLTIIYADSAAGKSMFVAAAVLSIGTGIPILHHNPTQSQQVLYLDWEDSPETLKERMDALLTGQNVSDLWADAVKYRRMEGLLADSSRSLIKQIAEHDIGVVVVDSLSLACGDPNDQTAVLAACNTARTLGVPVVMIHHLSAEAAKSKRMDDKRPMGSVFSRSSARLCWLIDKVQIEDSDEVFIRLWNTKINRGRIHPPQFYKVEFSNNEHGHMRSASYTPVSSMDFHEARLAASEESAEESMPKRKHPPIRELILLVLRSRSNIACRDIAADVSKIRGDDADNPISEEHIRVEMKRGRDSGIFEITGNEGQTNLWSLRS
tara:strand:- start:7627 stop:8997 length:1371 start_codon:yes stop_codon:yes gene_type:complete